MKCLIVYEAGGQWFGSDVSWKRSGSGFYRETSGIAVPQTREEIERFASRDSATRSSGEAPRPARPPPRRRRSPRPRRPPA